MYQSIRSLKLYPSSPTGNPPLSILTFDDWVIQVPVPGVKIENSVQMPYVSVGFDDQLFFEKEKLATITFFLTFPISISIFQFYFNLIFPLEYMLVIVNSILTDKTLVVLERIASSGSNTLCHPGKIQITHWVEMGRC